VQVSVTCRHGSITDEVRDYITQKAEKLLTFFERVFAIAVTVDINKDHVAVELLVDTEHRHNFVASDRGDDVPGAFDSVMHKMEQQIKKYKEKLQDHRRDKGLNEVSEQKTEPGEPEED
jgi:ribosome hibernation promoting factor